MASLVNEDGVPLNVIGAVRNDGDASAFASHLRGELTTAQKREQDYYTPAESLSTINEQVHALYDTLLKIKNNPENYTEEQINKALDNQDLLDRLNENYFSGNYQAKLGDREGAAYKYWRMYRSNKKNWDKRRDAMVANEKKKLDDKGMKITDEMTPKQKREMRNKRQEALNKVRNKYNRGDLGQQINYLIGKVNEILLEEPPRYKEDERFSAAAYVPRQMTARQAKAAAAIRGLPNLRELRQRRAQREQERQERMSRFAEGYTKSSPAKASSKPKAESAAAVAKPTAKQNWSSNKWRGPYKSRRNPEKRYLVRVEDDLGVFLDDEGKLTERNIRKAEEHKAKKEAPKKAAKRKGGRRTRKKRGKGKQKKRESPKSKKKRDTTKDRLKKALKRQQKEREARIAELRAKRTALVVPDDGLEHSDDFAAGIFNPNAPDEDEFVASIGLPSQEVDEGVSAAAAVDDYGRDWGQFSSEGGGRKTRKMKGASLAELNHVRSRYIHQLRQRERLERELQECRQDLHNATSMDSAGVRESKSNLEGGRRKTRKMKGGHHLYKRLGVSKYASQKQIKKAYNKLKKKKKLTQKVKYAYKILSKKKSRKKYNAKYKKHKKHKNTKKRKKRKKRKGGLPSVTVKAQIWPENYRPDVNVVNSNQPNVRTWTANLAN